MKNNMFTGYHVFLLVLGCVGTKIGLFFRGADLVDLR